MVMNDLLSPYNINEMFHKKFDGFDFAEPYMLGEFKDDPNKGHITIGVRTPWYDIEYFVYSKASFWAGIATTKSVEDVIQKAVGHLNTAVAMQLSPDGSKAIRLDIGAINKYQEDPESYIAESDGQESTTEQGGVTVYVNHDNVWTDQTLVEASVVTFLCRCTKCKRHADHILELRREK